MEKYMIMYGNVVDGMKFIGTFDTVQDAHCYAEINLPHELWLITHIQCPNHECEEATDGQD